MLADFADVGGNSPIRTMALDKFMQRYKVVCPFWYEGLWRGFTGKVFVAGGALRDWLTTSSKLIGKDRYAEECKVSDIDCFFPDEVTLFKFGQHLETMGFAKSPGINERVVNYCLLEGDEKLYVQLVKLSWYDSVAEVVSTFDLSPCMWALDNAGSIAFGRHTPHDTRRKRMRIHRITYPMSTMRRIIKYAKKGYFACNGTLTTASMALADASRNGDPNLNVTYVD